MGQSPIKVIVGLLVTNLLYLFLTLFLSLFIDAITIDVFRSPDSFIDRMVSVWLLIGTLLGIADFLTVLNFISSITRGY